MNERKSQAIVDKINKRFPKARAIVWNGQPMIGEQSEFNQTIEGIGIEIPMVDYYAAGSRTYPNGMLSEVEEFIENLGLYGEWHDAGTMCLYEM